MHNLDATPWPHHVFHPSHSNLLVLVPHTTHTPHAGVPHMRNPMAAGRGSGFEADHCVPHEESMCNGGGGCERARC